ncbi:MAG: hypothetical protein IPK76_11610 [Lewinellaceae bacterium]|jgi:hypothetical protein|nr:hypothetical protein [Lewinellaceae bacterium]
MENKRQNLDFKDLKKLISEGHLGKVLIDLVDFIEGVDTKMTTEIYLTSARFRKLELEKIRGQVTVRDYQTEFNSITFSLLEIIETLSNLDLSFSGGVPSRDDVKKEIEHLSWEFEKTNEMKSVLSELRMKIHIARKIAEKLVLWPDMIQDYRGTSDPALICAIGRKVKIIPDVEDLDILVSLIPHAKSNITKGFITNAIAELIYSGQLRLGDDITIREMLEELEKDGDAVLIENIERVEALLDFLSGKVK